MRLMLLLVTAFSLLSGCATHNDPGWQGNDAHPFNAADTICQSEANAKAMVERDMVYNGCMLRHGWTRPPSSAQR